ncbi:helix-turn-helix domain-containing protein [Kaistia geumhonensis]|uniref:AraC-like DNA-binding protein n=1 Tax=Kaistia geumhonensis TaxID=410839 RepID=A0ABU0M0L9_9HYPH|nr:helix-turn-helix domain-containing protein [Kaistia geumhonensis]MCX5480272.1 helix-turn-helix domain-containing protein [Kaistia geumhonensis]MDQ0514496.1 AraC-like DNA-binding protein [Kaistia geumhonensis]
MAVPLGEVSSTLPSGKVEPIRIVTKELALAEQFEAWRDFMSAAIDIELPTDTDDGFDAEQEVWNLGSMALARARMPGGERVWHHLDRHPLDHWCLVLVIPDRARSAEPELFLRSLARPFEGYGNGAETVVSLYVPRDLFRSGAATLDRLDNMIPSGPLSALLADYVLSLSRRLPELPPEAFPAVIEATREMIGACLLPSADRLEAANDVLAASLVDRARRIVNQHLGAFAFGPVQLGRMLGVSRSRLYRLFEPLGGVTAYIRRQRLLAAHRALLDPLETSAIVAIAERVGFPDASAFSRAFRAEFGYSPSQARAALARRTAAPSMRRPGMGPGGSSLGDILNRIGA